MMKKADPELEKALSQMLDKIDESIKKSGYRGKGIRMFLAGGLAVNFYCGSRHTMDVDASFSHKVLLPYADLAVDYRQKNGQPASIYFDQNFNPAFSLLHEDYEDDAIEWAGIGNEQRSVKLFVLSPVDLAVSKLSRFSGEDRADIKRLAVERLFSIKEFRTRAEEAFGCYIGNMDFVRANLDFACEELAKSTQRPGASLKKPNGPSM